MASDFSIVTLEAHKSGAVMSNTLQKNNFHLRQLYPTEQEITCEDKTKS